MLYDVAIIGTGPAGMSAALTLKLHNKSVIWFGSADLSSKVGKSEKIANYPGVAMVSGQDLNAIFKTQIEEAGLEITDKQITTIMPMTGKFMLQGGMDIYEAKTLLLATGAVSAKGFPGEESLLGAGVSYCATCDGFLYKGKTIAVYCGSKRFEHEVTYLAELAEKVYAFAPYKDLGAFPDNVVVNDGKIKAILSGAPGDGADGAGAAAGGAVGGMMTLGGPKIGGVELIDGRTLDVDGVFILREAVAPASLVKGLEIDGADIVVDRGMRTNKPGVFAAGDCTGRPYQITKATGEGNIAAHSIIEYLSEMEKEA